MRPPSEIHYDDDKCIFWYDGPMYFVTKDDYIFTMVEDDQYWVVYGGDDNLSKDAINDKLPIRDIINRMGWYVNTNSKWQIVRTSDYQMPKEKHLPAPNIKLKK